MLDLKKLRKDILKLTQIEFAEHLDITQDALSRLESNPDKIQLKLLYKIMDKFGVSPETLLQYKLTMEVNPVVNINTATDQGRLTLKTAIKIYLDENINNPNNKIKDEMYDLKQLSETLFRVPKVGIIGLSDAGKSTFINTLIGQNKIPADYTPMTSIVLFIKHVSRRPSFISEDVWIFKNDDKNNIWNENMLFDEKYCNDLRIAYGNYKILKTYGTREGIEDTNDAKYASSGVLFVDSPLLKDCDIIDFPGYGTGDRDLDTTLTMKGSSLADVLIYMSISNGFLRGEEINYLSSILRTLIPIEKKSENSFRPLENLFIVASQAQVINEDSEESRISKLNRILKKGAERLTNSVDENFLENRTKICGYTYNKEILHSRFYYYSRDNDELRRPLESAIINLVPRINTRIKEIGLENMREYLNKKTELLKLEINKLQNILTNRSKMKEIYECKEKKRTKLKAEIREAKIELIEYVNQTLNKSSKKEFSLLYEELINFDSIINLIETRGVKNKRESLEEFSTYISSRIQTIYCQVIEDNAKLFSSKFEKYICEIDKYISEDALKTDIKINSINVKNIFISGISSLATLGGLTFWFGTLGNLGGYILVAKTVSILTGLGISITGGTAAAVSAVAAIGGPITIAIGISILVGTIIGFLFGFTWKKDIAKKLVKAFNEQNTLKKYQESIDKYWEDTRKAIDAGTDALYDSLDSELSDLVKKLNVDDYSVIESEIVINKELMNFIENIPCIN